MDSEKDAARGLALTTGPAQGVADVHNVGRTLRTGPIRAIGLARIGLTRIGGGQRPGSIASPRLPGAVRGLPAQAERIAEQAPEQGEGPQDEEVDKRQNDTRDGLAEALDEGREGGGERHVAWNVPRSVGLSNGPRRASSPARDPGAPYSSLETLLEEGPPMWIARSRQLLAPLLLVLVAAALWRGTWDAGWISEDAAVVRHLTQHGGLGDWFDSQYGMRSILFWRPLVSTTLVLQLDLFGPDPTALRIFNALCHLSGALITMRLARALGCGGWASLVAALLALTFPYQGGTVTWIVGRVDSLCWPLVVGAGLCVARGRARLGLLCAFAAVASKEIGVAAAPLAVAIALWSGAESERVAKIRRAARWTILGVLVALFWRGLALGEAIGGYPGEKDYSDPVGNLVDGFLVLGPLAFALPFAIALGRGAHILRGGPIGIGAVASAAALVPLIPLLRNGVQPEHLRWLLIPDGLLCLAWAGCCARAPWLREPVRIVPMGVLLAGSLILVGTRYAQARTSVLTWAAAADQVEAFVAPLAARSAAGAPDELPLLALNVPRRDVTNTAYTLHLGLPEHFRPPLAELGRSIWPWRPTYGNVRLDPPGSVQDGLFDPALQLGTLDVEGPRALTIEGIDTRGTRWKVSGDGLSLVLMTELGYEFAPLPPANADGTGYSLETLLGAVGATELWRTLAFVSDFGSRRALFTFVTRDGRSSTWIDLRWDDATVAALVSELTKGRR